MCGIIGILGREPVAPAMIEALKRLEYRGYDSAGVATLENGHLTRRRAEGKLRKLEELLERKPLQGQIGIGHTRWATHGRPNETNAHPHALEVKSRQTGLLAHFDRAHSTHEFGQPKEHPPFWDQFAAHTGIDLERSVLIDDTETVLQGALEGGVGQVLAVRRPSMRHPARPAGSRFVEVHSLADLVLPP